MTSIANSGTTSVLSSMGNTTRNQHTVENENETATYNNSNKYTRRNSTNTVTEQTFANLVVESELDVRDMIEVCIHILFITATC